MGVDVKLENLSYMPTLGPQEIFAVVELYRRPRGSDVMSLPFPTSFYRHFALWTINILWTRICE